MTVATRARAKINLTLHVPRRRDDGWHELVSLVAFAGCGDHVTLTPGLELALTIAGPMGSGLEPGPDNLVLRAARHLAAAVAPLRVGRFHLTKLLPVASGIGGGSADAAAALRLLGQINGLAPDDDRVLAAARATGADVPVCVASRARIMAGTGERLGPPLRLAALFAVLVNPRAPLETRAVFAGMGLRPGEARSGAPHPGVADDLAPDHLLAAIGAGRNDMEPAARALLPIIDEELADLAAAPGCRLARMSGSGATCFGLFADCHAAAAAAAALRRRHPGWWIKATVLR